MERTRRILGLVTCASGAAYAVWLVLLAVWAFTGDASAPVRSPYLLLLGVPLLGGTLAWTGYALLRNSVWVHAASTIAAGAAAGLVLTAFTLELTWRWQHPLETVGGPPLEIWSTLLFLAFPAVQTVLVRVLGPGEREGAEPPRPATDN